MSRFRGAGVRLLAAAPTPALRRAVFGGDDDLDEGGLRAALALSAQTHPAQTHPERALSEQALSERALSEQALSEQALPEQAGPGRDGPEDTPVWFRAPSRAAAQTARALGHDDPVVDQALADPRYGTWHGLGLDEVAGRDPDGLRAWLSDPDAAPHGGESLAGLRRRVGAWLDSRAERRTVAVAHPVVVRAALTHALGLPDAAVWQLEVAPLSLTRLTHRTGRWHVSFPPAG